jgi:Zn-dependent metalloprotease
LLKDIAKDLEIKPNLADLKFDKVRKTILGSHVLYQQFHEGKPITGAWIRVDIDKDGKVYNINNDLIPHSVLAKTKKTAVRRRADEAREVTAESVLRELSAKEAKNIAIEVIGVAKDSSNKVLQDELVYYPHKGIPTLARKIVVKTTIPIAEWKIYLDAKTGEVLYKNNQLKDANGKGRIFNPNPVVTLNDTALKDSSQIPDSAYSEVALENLDDSGMIDGPFVSTRATSNRVNRSDHQFIFSREDRAFKEVMVYYHIDRIQRYIQELGFDNVLNHQIAVNIDGRTDDNSHYSPFDKDLTFGVGGVDDAEDAEIIAHEYGHAIQDDQVPGWGESHEGGSMGEAFGDYLAASFFACLKSRILRPTMGNWDAVAYSGDEPPCLRRLDSNKKYPKDIVGEVHADGEIWSACLWELLAALGRRMADQLIIAHHFLLTRFATFENAAHALITADKTLNQGHNESMIREVFVKRGILPNPRRNNKRAGLPFDQRPHVNVTNIYGNVYGNYTENDTTLGDKFEKVSNSTIVNKALIQNSFNKIQRDYNEDTSRALKQVAKFIEESSDPSSDALFNQFIEELNKPQADRSRLKNLWSGIEKVLPKVTKIAAVSKIDPVFV